MVNPSIKEFYKICPLQKETLVQIYNEMMTNDKIPPLTGLSTFRRVTSDRKRVAWSLVTCHPGSVYLCLAVS